MCKHEDLSADPSNHIKSGAWWGTPAIPALDRTAEVGGSLGSTARKSSQSVSSRCNEGLSIFENEVVSNCRRFFPSDLHAHMCV